MVIWVLIINTILSIIFLIVRLTEHADWKLVFFFLFLPFVGFIIYYLPIIAIRIRKKSGFDEEGILARISQVELQPDHPDVKDELNLTPIEDAIAVSDNTEKRALLLKQLKKNLRENYKILLVADQDEDSECAHYVAAAKMEIYRILQQHWLDCRQDYEKSPDNTEYYHQACDALLEILKSGVFSLRELNVYRKYFCNLVQTMLNTDKSKVSPTEYEEYLICLADLGRFEDAERFWIENADQLKSENAYIRMLKLYYQNSERNKFENCLKDLQKNRQIRLSAKGLEQLRYWTSRLSAAEEHF